jgi:hypothetical protein
MANADKKTEDVEMKDAAPEAERKPQVVPFALDKGMYLLVHMSLVLISYSRFQRFRPTWSSFIELSIRSSRD